MSKSIRRTWLTGVLLVAGIVPSVALVGRALAQDLDDNDEPSAETPADKLSKRRRAVLAAVATDEAILINVTSREMPASPDILNLGKRSARALTRCVSDNVVDHLRAFCAELLGRLGDRTALPALQGALEAWSPAVRRAAIDALRAIPDPSSFEPLQKLLLREDEGPEDRAAILKTLGALSDHRAVRLLRERLHTPPESDVALRTPAFEGLWKSRHLMARATLVSDVAFALKSTDPSLTLRGTFAASELRAPELVAALIPLMRRADVRIKNRAVYALGRIGDRAATSALLAQIPLVRESRMLNNIAFALERLDPRAFYATARTLVDHQQAAIRMNAAFVLGDVRRAEGVPLLTKLLVDNDSVRVSAVTALGKLDAPAAAPLLEKFVDDANPAIKEEAIYALHALSGGTRTDLVYTKLFDSTNPATHRRAALALGKSGDPRVTGELLKCLEAQQCALGEVDGFLRAATAPEVPGRLLLAWTRGRSDLTDLVAFRKPEGAAAIAQSDVGASVASGDRKRSGFAVDLAGDLGDRAAIPTMKPLLTSDNARLRVHAAVALARLDQPDADAVILRELDVAPQDRLGTLVRLLGRIAEPVARARLLPELAKRERGGDVAIALAAAAIHLEWDAESAVFRMLEALDAPRVLDRELAERYLTRSRQPTVTWLLRRALARETRDYVKDRLRKILDVRSGIREKP